MLRKIFLAMSCILMQTDYSHSAAAAAAASGAGADFETNVLSRNVMPRAPAAMHHEEIDGIISRVSISNGRMGFSCAPLSEKGEELLLNQSIWMDSQGHPYFYDPEKDKDPERVIFPDQERISDKIRFSSIEEGVIWSVKYDLGEGRDALRYFLLCQKDHTVDELSITAGYKIVNFLSRHLYVATEYPHDTKNPYLSLFSGLGSERFIYNGLGNYPRDLLHFMLYEETEKFIFIGFPAFDKNPAIFHVIGKKSYDHVEVKRDGIHGFSWYGSVCDSLVVSHKDPSTGLMSISGVGVLSSFIDSLSLPPSTSATKSGDISIIFRDQDGHGFTEANTMTGETKHFPDKVSERSMHLGFSTERFFVPSSLGNPIEVIIQYAGDPRISRKTILEVHGGPVSEETGEIDLEAHLTKMAGFNYVTLNYSGSSSSTELFLRGKGQFGNGILEEVFDVARWLREEVKVNSLGISGGSYGGYTVLLAAASEEGQKLFDYGLASLPLADVNDLLSGRMPSAAHAPNGVLMGLEREMSEAEYRSRVEVLERSSSPRHSAGKIKMPLMVTYSGLDGSCPPEAVAATMAVVRASNPYPTVVIEQPLHKHIAHPLVAKMQVEFANHIASKGRDVLFPWRAEQLTPHMEHFNFTGVHFMPHEFYQAARAARLNWKYTLPVLEEEVNFHHVYRRTGLRPHPGMTSGPSLPDGLFLASEPKVELLD